MLKQKIDLSAVGQTEIFSNCCFGEQEKYWQGFSSDRFSSQISFQLFFPQSIGSIGASCYNTLAVI